MDRQTLHALQELPQVVQLEAAHAQEHSLEVQLPFLQVMLREFDLLPLVVGDATGDQVAEVLARVWGGGRDPDRDQLRSQPLSRLSDGATHGPGDQRCDHFPPS